MAAHANNSPRRSAKKNPWTMLPVVAVCGVLVAACMVVGDPALFAAKDPAAPDASPVENGAGANPSVSEPDNGLSLVGSYQSISQSEHADRAENIRLATEAIDGVVILPGETFSFNEVVGDVSEESGYLMAPIVADGATIDGVGGGICQVSTTLYIAALKADLEIVERHAHSLASDYAPIGLDATIVTGLMDLKIKNDTEVPVRISAHALGQTVSIEVYGQPLPEGESVDATAKIVDRYDEATDVGTETYYVAESYRVYYQDGVKTHSVLLSTDTYLVPKESVVMLAEGGVSPTK